MIFGTLTAFYDLIIYEPKPSFLAVLFDAIAFLLTLIFMSMIYIAFLYRSIEAYKGVKEPIYKRAFLSLAAMALCFMLILLNFLIDRILILVLNIPGFTIFYYLAWIFAIIGIICAYLGYIKPEAGQLK
jgi:phage-related holin